MAVPNPITTPKLSLSFIIGFGLVILVIIGLVLVSQKNQPPAEIPVQIMPTSTPAASPSLTIEPEVTLTPPANFSQLKAFKMADTNTSACAKVGMVGAPEVYNPNSQTWWFKLVPFQTQEGCSPACVVHLNGKVEVNWRCTGLNTP